jgi:transcriptional regulator with XRE-family HTH domain
VAERLKEAREARGLSYRQIADVTKLSTRVVSALEDGRVDLLPHGIYRRSIVRVVSSEVGLDPEEVLRAFLDECPDDLPMPGEAAAAVDAREPSPRGRWRRALAMLGAVVPLVTGVAYFASRPAPPSAGPSPTTASSGNRGAWPPEVVPAGGLAEAPPPDARPVSMLVTVSARCQLRLFADGRQVIARILEAGERLEVAFADSVELWGDDAGAVQFSINGQAGRILGAAGEPLTARIGRDDYDLYLARR